MKLWLCALVVGCCVLGKSNGQTDEQWTDAEQDALHFVFGPDNERHTGVERLHWHMAHLKWTTRFLGILNGVRREHESGTFIRYMSSYEEEWRMYDIIRQLHHLGYVTDLKFDIYEGDSYIIPKMAWHIDRQNFTQWVGVHIDNWGNDFLKYVVQKPDFNYSIINPETFVDAFYNFEDPATFASKVGMTMQQLRTLDEAFENVLLPRPEYWTQPMLILEIAHEMCQLELLDCSTPRPSIFDEGNM